MTVCVIPCYNVDALCLEAVRGATNHCTHIIAVDDGSTDDTLKNLQALQQSIENLIILRHEKNRGKGDALLTGMRYALEHFPFTALITIDGDGQHYSENIPLLAFPIQEGVHLSIGSRDISKMPLRNRLSNLFIAYLLRFLYPMAPKDTQTGMRGFSHYFVNEIVHHIEGGRYEMEFRCLLLALSYHLQILSVPIPTIYLGKEGVSHFSLIRDSYRILKVLFMHWIHRHDRKKAKTFSS